MPMKTEKPTLAGKADGASDHTAFPVPWGEPAVAKPNAPHAATSRPTLPKPSHSAWQGNT
jgi:hypothetical protein